MPSRSWTELAARSRPSWYLDTEVALQKRAIHQELIRRWLGRHPPGRIFKTDLFEDAWGRDAIIFDLFESGSATLFGTDISLRTVQAAAARAKDQPLHCFTCDLRRLPIRPSSLDAVISTSTLDHFVNPDEFYSALTDICDCLKPEGSLVITLDNPQNLFYWALRICSLLRLSPFVLGYSPSATTLMRALADRGLQVTETRWLIHNPRLLSTVLVMILRRSFGKHARGPIRTVLRLFALQENLWPRFSACFYAVLATKREV